MKADTKGHLLFPEITVWLRMDALNYSLKPNKDGSLRRACRQCLGEKCLCIFTVTLVTFVLVYRLTFRAFPMSRETLPYLQHKRTSHRGAYNTAFDQVLGDGESRHCLERQFPRVGLSTALLCSSSVVYTSSPTMACRLLMAQG